MLGQRREGGRRPGVQQRASLLCGAWFPPSPRPWGAAAREPRSEVKQDPAGLLSVVRPTHIRPAAGPAGDDKVGFTSPLGSLLPPFYLPGSLWPVQLQPSISCVSSLGRTELISEYGEHGLFPWERSLRNGGVAQTLALERGTRVGWASRQDPQARSALVVALSEAGPRVFPFQPHKESQAASTA